MIHQSSLPGWHENGQPTNQQGSMQLVQVMPVHAIHMLKACLCIRQVNALIAHDVSQSCVSEPRETRPKTLRSWKMAKKLRTGTLG